MTKYPDDFGETSMQARRFVLARMASAVAVIALCCPGSTTWAQTVRADFREPVTLASRDGVLEVRLTARQGQATLDTVSRPVENFLLFSYELIRGAASDGSRSGSNIYPAPTLQVFPGEQLIVHLDNSMSGLTIRDYYSPQYIAKGQTVPLYPEQMTASPINLHTHGLHVSPKGNSDNVLLHIPVGMSNTYTYDIPATCHTERTGITAICTGLRPLTSSWAWSDCWRSAARTATCRW